MSYSRSNEYFLLSPMPSRTELSRFPAARLVAVDSVIQKHITYISDFVKARSTDSDSQSPQGAAVFRAVAACEAETASA